MFCPLCGNKILESHKFCCKCGNPSPVDTGCSLNITPKAPSSLNMGNLSVDNSTRSTPQPTPTFEQFQAAKRKERASNFRSKGNAKKCSKSVEDTTGEVVINLGIMFFDGNQLKPQRSKNLSVKVPKVSTKDDLLTAALAKHKAHSKNLIKDNVKYVLLYPDGTRVDKLRESDDEFVLYKYKREFGKAYQRIYLYICPSRDYDDNTIKVLTNLLDESDDSDLESVKLDGEVVLPVQSGTTVIATKECGTSITAVTTTSSKVSGNLTLANSLTTTIDLTTTSHQGYAPSTTSDVLVENINYLPDILGESIDSATDVQVDSRGIHHISGALVENEDSLYESISEMFPHHNPSNIRDALSATNNNLEAAANLIITNQAQSTTTHEQIYASFEFCNDITNDLDFNENNSPINEEAAVENLEEESRSNVNSLPLHEILTQTAKKKIKSDCSLRVKVRRSHVWEDVKAKLARCTEEDLEQVIRVQFVGEPAVDQGGPKREFFSLLHKHMNDSNSMFTGESNNKYFSNNVIALDQQDYLKYGRLCAMSIIQGSPSPSFFSPPVVDYILYGSVEKVKTSPVHIQNEKVKKKLEELQITTDPEEFKQLASFNCSMRFKAGYTKPIVTIEDKDSLIRYLCLHFTLLYSLPHVDQFINGLKLYGLLQAVRHVPEKARVLFQACEENHLNAEMVDDLFQIQFSPEGSNRRREEEAIAMHFTRLLEDIELGAVKGELFDFSSECITEVVFSLGDILQFITGSPSIPPMGFQPQPVITFNHVDANRKLQANTCANQILLPVNDLLVKYESFKAEFTSCILMSPGFGSV